MSKERPGEPGPWSRPAFQPGHALSLIHGASSPRVIEARAAKVHAAILEVAPWIDEPHYAPEVARYLRACAREELLHAAIEKVASEKGADRVPARQWEQATAAARLASQLAAGLGLTPAGHARLKAMTGQAAVVEHTLADLAASGREARLRAEARMAAGATAGAAPAVRPSLPSEPAKPTGAPSGACDGVEGDG